MVNVPNEEELILRDRLAIERTRLANERTLLAYIRTAIMIAVTGVTLIKFFGDSQAMRYTGWVFIALGAGVVLIAVRRFRRLVRALV